MTSRQTTSTATLGWPKAGDIAGSGKTVAVPIDFGGGETIVVTDPAWARQLANAAIAAASVLESVLGIDLLDLASAGDAVEPGEASERDMAAS
ncbi:hypothetical protein ACIBG4_40475 [Nonomuraea sp. NPDC050383]|uniref:hypothetical protein n=1 Tax=Nonomuraea sp. NPDC050383 TaxID=3364362 RepID=UPI00379AF056